MVFQKYRSKKRSTYVVEQLVKAIQERAYRPGDKLPSERDMAERMGVSRAAVREGLAALAMRAIVQIKHGDGTYVLRTPGEADTSPLEVEEIDIWEVIEARRAIEDSNVKLASERIDEEGLKRIEQPLHQMSVAMERSDFEQYLDANMDFHLAIAAVTQNRQLQQMTHHLVHVMELYQQARLDYYLENPKRFRALLDHHHQIFEAIKAGDAQRASLIMKEHFDYFEQTAKEMDLEKKEHGAQEEELSRSVS